MQPGKIVLAFGLLVLLGLGAYFYMQQSMAPMEENREATSTDATPETATAPTAKKPVVNNGNTSPTTPNAPTAQNESVDDLAAGVIAGGDTEAAETASEDEDAALLDAEADAAADFSDSYDENSF